MEDTELLQEIKTVLLGIPNTTERGLSGDIKRLREDTDAIKNELRQMNGAVKSNTAFRQTSKWFVGLFMTAVGALIALYFRIMD